MVFVQIHPAEITPLPERSKYRARLKQRAGIVKPRFPIVEAQDQREILSGNDLGDLPAAGSKIFRHFGFKSPREVIGHAFSHRITSFQVKSCVCAIFPALNLSRLQCLRTKPSSNRIVISLHPKSSITVATYPQFIFLVWPI